MSAHSILAPSSAVRWKRCAGSIAATQHVGDTSNEYAREGTAAHVLGADALGYGRPASFWLGRVIEVPYEEDGVEKTQAFTVDDEMADNVQVYVDAVERLPGKAYIEQELDLSESFGVPEQKGTGDAIVLNEEAKNIHVDDLKYGRNIVYAEGNDQLYSYGDGALKKFDMLGDWETITVAIHQPRINHYDEHTLTRAELEAWRVETAQQANVAMGLLNEPMEVVEASKLAGDKQCQWCPIKGACQTLAKWTNEQVYDDFTSLAAEPSVVTDPVGISDELLGKLLHRAPVIKKALEAWQAEANARALTKKIPGWKRVPGKGGKRMWSDKDEAEKILKAARIKSDDMYSKNLVTFPAAETKFKKAKPKVWAKLKAMFTQSEGSPTLVPDADPRPELVVADSEAFKDVSESKTPSAAEGLI